MEPTARRLASPWRTHCRTFAASLLAKYEDRSALLSRCSFGFLAREAVVAAVFEDTMAPDGKKNGLKENYLREKTRITGPFLPNGPEFGLGLGKN